MRNYLKITKRKLANPEIKAWRASQQRWKTESEFIFCNDHDSLIPVFEELSQRDTTGGAVISVFRRHFKLPFPAILNPIDLGYSDAEMKWQADRED